MELVKNNEDSNIIEFLELKVMISLSRQKITLKETGDRSFYCMDALVTSESGNGELVIYSESIDDGVIRQRIRRKRHFR